MAGGSIGLLIVLIFNIFSGTYGESRIKFENNGYKNIVVAFAPSMPQSVGEPLIPAIKDLFISASPALFQATRNQAYFSEVVILVPESWEWRKEYSGASFENFGEADIKIDSPNPQYADGPYTLQTMPCGDPGLFIHLTPNYLSNLRENSTILFGDPAKTLVHEWAHFRYGIFDEFGYHHQPQMPLIYFDSFLNEVVPNACTNKKVKGRYWDYTKNFMCNYIDGLPDENCIFEPDLVDNDATSSMGSYHFLPNVTTFCDDTDEHHHNPRAPNKHNILCDYKSTWKVISSHKDFARSKPLESLPQTQLTFKIVQQMENTFSLVLDVSGSMDEGGKAEISKLAMMNTAITNWLKSDVKLLSAVGIIWFSSGIDFAGTMKRITDNNVRNDLIKELPPKTIGATCIGCGLNAGVKQLKDYRRKNGGTIILLTDGAENESPYISQVLKNVMDAKVKVISIAFTNAATTALEDLTRATGGKAYFVGLDEGAEGLQSAFFDAITYQTADFDLPVKVLENDHDGTERIMKGSFPIDESIGNHTVVQFHYSVKNDINSIWITGPDTQISNLDSGTTNITIENDNLAQMVKFTFFLLKSGTYNYIINRTGMSTQKVSVIVTSKARGGVQPITTQTRTEFKMYGKIPKLLITAEVKQGNNPIIYASVVAQIQRPDAEAVLIQLFDNGDGSPDTTKNDGIYSNHFTNFTTAGRYVVKAQVASDGKTSVQEDGFLASQSMPIVNKYMAEITVTTKPTGDFERSSEGGVISISNNQLPDPTVLDSLPPNQVKNLQLAHFSSLDSSVTLKWTAPGDDYRRGKDYFYDIRYSTSWDNLFPGFDGIIAIANLNAHDSGVEETYKFQLQNVSFGTTYFFALRTYDSDKRYSQTSNIAQARFPSPPDSSELHHYQRWSHGFNDTYPCDNHETNSNTIIIIIIASVVGAVLVLSMVAVSCYCWKKRSTKIV